MRQGTGRRLAQLLHGIPAQKIILFAVPSYPRADVVPSDTTNVLWTQPAANEIFASLRNDAQVSRALHAAGGHAGRFGAVLTAQPGTSQEVPLRSADMSICVG
jgi:hypothetical protein